MKASWLGGLFMAAAIGVAQPASALIIDDFVEDVAQTDLEHQTDGAMLGGQRDVQPLFGGSSPPLFSASGGAATVSGNNPFFSASLYMNYDGVDGSADLDPMGLGGIDLTEGGTGNRFFVDVTAVTGEVGLFLEAFAADSLASSSWQASFITTPGLIEFDFASPTFTDFGGVDLTNVGGIRIFIGSLGVLGDAAPIADSITIASIYTNGQSDNNGGGGGGGETEIPTPAALPAGLLALGTLATRRRRR